MESKQVPLQTKKLVFHLLARRGTHRGSEQVDVVMRTPVLQNVYLIVAGEREQ